MRILLPAILCLGACTTTGTIAVTGASERANFEFRFHGGAPRVMGIDVYELEGGRRTRSVCSLDRQSLWDKDVAPISEWQYGQDVGTNYRAQACAPLERGHTYGVNLFHSAACMTLTRFRIDENGSVADLAASETECGR